MAFMEPEIIGCDYWEVSANHGETHYVPCDVESDPAELADYVDGTIDLDDDGKPIAERKTGFLARLSAPGYMDCTDWTAHDTEDEARAYLAETFGDDDDDDDEPTDDEPTDEDLTTEDHSKFYSVGGSGRLAFEIEGDPNDGAFTVCTPAGVLAGVFPTVEHAIRAYCDHVQFWPNVWFISDHGNAHRIDLTTETDNDRS